MMKLNLPSWLRRDELKLPPWAKVAKVQRDSAAIIVEVDCDAAYPAWLAELGNPTVDQYWLEVAYQCIKLDVQAALVGTKYDPRTAGKHAVFKFSRAEAWEQAKHPAGKGAEAASRGKEARGHYTRIRGSLPM